MFEKILKELKTKYANLGLSETILKVTSETLAKTVEKEEEVETAVAGVEGQMKIYQSFADQTRTLQTEITNLKKAGEGKTEEKKEEKKEGEEKKETGNEIPAWAQAIIDSNKTLSENLTAIKEKETAQTNAQKLQTKLDELKVSKTIQALIPAGLTFENDEAIEAYANDMKSKSDAIAQEFGNSALAATVKPLFGEAKKEGEVSPDVQAYLDAKKPVKDNE